MVREPLLFAHARSRLPSLLKSAATRPAGVVPAAKFVASPNDPSPLPSRMLIVRASWFVVARGW